MPEIASHQFQHDSRRDHGDHSIATVRAAHSHFFRVVVGGGLIWVLGDALLGGEVAGRCHFKLEQRLIFKAGMILDQSDLSH